MEGAGQSILVDTKIWIFMILNAEVDLAIGPLAEPVLIVGAIRYEPSAEECYTVDRVALGPA
jgi:hypothetical protein